MKTIFILCSLLLVLPITACGGDDDSGNGSDSDTDSDSDGDTDTDTDADNGIHINAALGVYLVQFPNTVGNPAEGPVTGSIIIGGQGLGDYSDTTVTINGIDIPYEGGEAFDPALATETIPVVPGGTMTIAAEQGDRHTEISFVCPTEVTLDTPEDNSAGDAGQVVTVSWTGQILYDNDLMNPMINLHSFDPVSGTMLPQLGLTPPILEGDETSYDLTLTDHGLPQYIVSLEVPGVRVVDDAIDSEGFCGLNRRAHLIKPEK